MNKPCPFPTPEKTGCHTKAVSTFRDHLSRGEHTHASFDVFDTLLLRRCTDPRGVFEKAYTLLALQNATASEANLYVQYRQLAERKARKAASSDRGSPEVSIAEIYAHFPLNIFRFGEISRTDLINAEHAAECALCFANPEILELYQDAQRHGLTCGFISDTYWSTAQLRSLLLTCIPDLEAHFVYASCDYGSGKSESLFHIYTNAQKLTPDQAVHIGDNLQADVRTPAALGIATVLYPQADPDLTAIFHRETTTSKRLNGPTHSTLDQGLRTERRQICGHFSATDAAFSYGASVIGPVMTAFDSFVATKVAKLREDNPSAAIAFLARDGLLPFQIWQARHVETASYVEINRRTALLGAADSDTFAQFFHRMSNVDLSSASHFLKGCTPQMEAYFQSAPNGIVKGRDFAKALPRLIDETTRHNIAQKHRKALLSHLRATIPNFDHCSDLILVDLGYSGTVQKGLRAVLDAESLPLRLHGLYLLTVDEDLVDLDHRDSATGYLSGSTLPPQTRHNVLANIAVLEQVCSAPTGSVQSYTEDGNVLREDDPRPQADKDLTHRIRDGVLAFSQRASGPAFADPKAIASWIAACLARALWSPTDTELSLLAPLRHDVNLGTRALAPMADPDVAQAHLATRPLLASMQLPQPPMWTAGSFSAASPMHGELYSLFASGHACLDSWGEAPLPATTVIAFHASNVERHIPITANCSRTTMGALRLRIPMVGNRNIGTVSIPAHILPPHGEVTGFTLQTGSDLRKATKSAHIHTLDTTQLHGVDLDICDGRLMPKTEDACLLFPVPDFHEAVALITLTIQPLDGLRILAPSRNGAPHHG